MLRSSQGSEVWKQYESLRNAFLAEEVINRYITLGKRRAGPCPKCGGRDRLHVNTSNPMLWACRKCHPQYSDALEFVAWMECCDHTKAAAILMGRVERGEIHRASVAEVNATRVITKKPWEDREWQAEKSTMVAAAQVKLFSPAGRPVSEYLRRRGLLGGTCKAFSIGSAAPTFKNPNTRPRDAVLVPWMFTNGQLMAVKYRYIAGDVNFRFAMEKGSAPLAFGGQTWAEQSTLVVLEGEFNAMSAWQVGNEFADFASFGSETNTNHLPEMCAGHRRVMLWLDDPIKLARALEALRGREGVTGLSSPDMDANDMLVKHGPDYLAGFLAEHLE